MTRERVRAATPRPAAIPAVVPVRRRRGRPPRVPQAPLSLPAVSLAGAQNSVGLVKSLTRMDLAQKVKDLLRLAKEQGHLTYDDLNDALPDDLVTPADLDQVLTKLRSLEIEIIDAAEVERGRQPEADEEEERGRYDTLDDPVRMYLR